MDNLSLLATALQDEGVVYYEYFNPFSDAALALVLTYNFIPLSMVLFDM